MLVPSLLTRRLELASLTPAFLRAVLEGHGDVAAGLIGARLPSEWAEEVLGLFKLRLAQLAEYPEQQPWLLRGMLERTPAHRFAGYINFHGPPDPRGAVEVGYTVLPAFRRRGYAEEAAIALFRWASGRGARTLIASIAPTNAPSLSLAAKLGFVQTGSQWDEQDGEELVFERPVRLAAPFSQRATVEGG